MILAILMQVINDGAALMPVEVVKMTIEQCLEQAALINANTDLPFVLLCGPDLGGVGV